MPPNGPIKIYIIIVNPNTDNQNPPKIASTNTVYKSYAGYDVGYANTKGNIASRLTSSENTIFFV